MGERLFSVGCGTGDVRSEETGMGGKSVDRGEMKDKGERKKIFVMVLFQRTAEWK